MKISLKNKAVILNFLQKNKGVITTSELKTLLQPKSRVEFYRNLKKMEEGEIVQKFCRGIYTIPNPDLTIVSQRLQPKSYLSFSNALAYHLVIGSIPKKTVYAIKIGKNRGYKNRKSEILFFGIHPNLFFGFETKNGIKMADKEKAFLDTLYFYQKGKKYSFDIYSDLTLERLDQKKINKYLKKYKNPKFVKFVQGFFA